jgi:vacuolar-type H+-ATPase subunit E/Vma4
MAINAEAERKAAQLQEEIQGLVRSLKTKDQTIQESGVKIELMERRMEAVKKQADTIAELESELSRARGRERAYEEAMEQLQADLDTLEQDNAKLKTLAAGSERQGMFYVSGSIEQSDDSSCSAAGVQPVDSENVPMEGNVETSHLLEQVCTCFKPFRHSSDFQLDRGSSWNGSLPSHRELVSQRARPPQGNTRTTTPSRTCQPHTYTSTGPLRSIRHRRIRLRTSIDTSYHSLSRYRNQGTLPRRHQILFITSCCGSFRSQCEENRR